MKNIFHGFFKIKSLFVRLMSGFLLVLITVTSFHLLSYRLYSNNIEKELLNNSEERMQIISTKFDNFYKQVMGMLYRIYDDEKFIPVLKNNISPNQRKALWELINTNKTLNESIFNIFVVNINLDMVITSEGVYDIDLFFNKIFKSSVYDKAFWFTEGKEKFYYNFYGADIFQDITDPTITQSYTLMPVALKKSPYPSVILVALLNLNEFAANNENTFLNNFYVVNGDRKPIYPLQADTGITDNALEDFRHLKKIEGGYLLTTKSKVGAITYVKYLEYSEISKLMTGTNLILVLLILTSVFLSLLLSYFISRRYNNLAKSIVNLMSSTGGKNGIFETDFKYIGSNIEKIVHENTEYNQQLKSKDSLLDSYFLRTRIKDIYLQSDDLKNSPYLRLNNDDNYLLICFTLHFRPLFYDVTNLNVSKGTYYIKELIDKYLKSLYGSCTTFQIEKCQVISIVSCSKSVLKPESMLEGIVEKLNEENEYVFFTIAVSEIQNDYFELEKVYRSIMDLSKHRMPLDHTQLIVEGVTKSVDGKFYFSTEQAERFLQFLGNGRLEECIKQIEDILDYNLRNGVDSFNMSLMCTEILNYGAKTVINLPEAARGEMDFKDYYARLGDCCTLEQYKQLCREFITKIIQMLGATQKSRDYIIDYIKDYVEKHYSEDIYLELFAGRLNLTKEYISLYFKNKTGINLSDYISKYRIEKAIYLLENTNERVQDIGEKVGLNTNTLIRVFKKYTGKTPNEYRHDKLQA